MKYRVVAEAEHAEAILSEDLSFSDHIAFQSATKELIAANRKHCVLDLSQLASVDSAGLGMLMIAHEECEKANHQLVIRGANGQVKRMLDLARFDTILRIEPSHKDTA